MKRLASLFAAAALLVAACKPTPGTSCSGHAKGCETPTSRLACSGGVYTLETCKGPAGCAEANGATTCDSTRADVGDPCVAENTGACSVDGKAKLLCQNGKLAFVTRCAGEGCVVDDRGEAHCENPFAKEGDVCIKGSACTEDGTAELACTAGKMVPFHPCRGRKQCISIKTSPNCDRSVGMVGEPCDANDPELAVACDPKGDIILVCKGGKLVPGPTCKGKFKCDVNSYGRDGRSHYQAGCDQSLAELGDACLKEGGLACSGDLKSRLTCTAGVFALDKACKKGCELAAADGTKFDCK